MQKWEQMGALVTSVQVQVQHKAVVHAAQGCVPVQHKAVVLDVGTHMLSEEALP